jgi:hypothetical protein
VSIVLFLFSLAHSLITSNVADWASTGRGMLVLAIGASLVFWLWRSGVRLSPTAAGLAGTIGALTISDQVHSLGGVGLSVWAVYAGTFLAQSKIKRNWRDDIAMAGVVLGGFIALNGLAAMPNVTGIFNRNTLAHILVVMSPALIDRWRWPGIVGGAGVLLLIGSRGALIAFAVVLIVMLQLWKMKEFIMLSVPFVFASIFLAVVVGVMMYVMRPQTVNIRIDLMRESIQRWWSTSPLFGVGPGGLRFDDVAQFGQLGFAHAHNLLVSLASQVGLVGVGGIGVSFALVDRWRGRLAGWQAATLAAAAALSLFEDISTLLPAGVILMLVLG